MQKILQKLPIFNHFCPFYFLHNSPQQKMRQAPSHKAPPHFFNPNFFLSFYAKIVSTPHSGLDYPGVGPQHCYLKDVGRGRYETATDQECLEAFLSLSRQEGIIPALESAHAVAYTLRRVKELGSDKRLLVNLSGRGDKDTDFVLSKLTL